MADVLTVEQRSRCMSAIRCKNTRPEIAVRKLVYALGYRYRLHVRSMPGSPDLVFSRLKKVIFVHGCFWHRHSCPLGQPMPKTRPEFWRTKLEGNRERDINNAVKLKQQGWKVLILWECEVDSKKALKLERKVATFLARNG